MAAAGRTVQVLLCRSRVSAGHGGEGGRRNRGRRGERRDEREEGERESGREEGLGEGRGGHIRQTAAFFLRVTFGNESQDLTKLIYGPCYNGGKHARRVSAQMVRLT